MMVRDIQELMAVLAAGKKQGRVSERAGR